MKKILLIGQTSLHWGRMEFGNIGNYYIIEPFIRGIHNVFPGVEIRTTLQMSDDFCKREKVTRLPLELYYSFDNSVDNLKISLHELEIAKIYSIENRLIETTPFIDEILNSDLIIDFSGDIWGDNANFLGEDRFYVGLLKDRVAQLLKKKTAMLAGSPGPFNDKTTKEFAKEVYKNFDLVINREALSTELLKLEEFDISNTKSLACPSFLFEPTDGESKNKLLKKIGLRKTETPSVGFILCGWNFELGPFDRWPRRDKEYFVFVEAVEYMINEFGADVYLMSHSNGFPIPPQPFKLIHGKDYQIIKQLQKILFLRKKIDVKKLHCLDGVYNTWDTKAIIGSFDMFISGRVHGAVAGLSQCVPTVIIDYGHEPKAHKLKGFANLLEVSSYVALPSDIESLREKIKQTFTEKEKLKNHLNNRINDIKTKARDSFLLLKNLK